MGTPLVDALVVPEGVVVCAPGSGSCFPGWKSLLVVCGSVGASPCLGCELDAVNWEMLHTDPDDFSAIANCLRCNVETDKLSIILRRSARNSRERGLARAWRPKYLGHLPAQDARAPLV